MIRENWWYLQSWSELYSATPYSDNLFKVAISLQDSAIHLFDKHLVNNAYDWLQF